MILKCVFNTPYKMSISPKAKIHVHAKKENTFPQNDDLHLHPPPKFDRNSIKVRFSLNVSDFDP